MTVSVSKGKLLKRREQGSLQHATAYGRRSMYVVYCSSGKQWTSQTTHSLATTSRARHCALGGSKGKGKLSQRERESVLRAKIASTVVAGVCRQSRRLLWWEGQAGFQTGRQAGRLAASKAGLEGRAYRLFRQLPGGLIAGWQTHRPTHTPCDRPRALAILHTTQSPAKSQLYVVKCSTWLSSFS